MCGLGDAGELKAGLLVTAEVQEHSSDSTSTDFLSWDSEALLAMELLQMTARVRQDKDRQYKHGHARPLDANRKWSTTLPFAGKHAEHRCGYHDQ